MLEGVGQVAAVIQASQRNLSVRRFRFRIFVEQREFIPSLDLELA